MEAKAKEFFNDASNKLKEANEELFRPEEDVVSYLVCKNAQHAIENYLKGYLLKNDINPDRFRTIDRLYNECKRINKDFEKVNLSGFDCKAQDIHSKYCLEVSKVSNCYNVANHLDSFLRDQKII